MSLRKGLALLLATVFGLSSFIPAQAAVIVLVPRDEVFTDSLADNQGGHDRYYDVGLTVEDTTIQVGRSTTLTINDQGQIGADTADTVTVFALEIPDALAALGVGFEYGFNYNSNGSAAGGDVAGTDGITATVNGISSVPIPANSAGIVHIVRETSAFINILFNDEFAVGDTITVDGVVFTAVAAGGGAGAATFNVGTDGPTQAANVVAALNAFVSTGGTTNPGNPFSGVAGAGNNIRFTASNTGALLTIFSRGEGIPLKAQANAVVVSFTAVVPGDAESTQIPGGSGTNGTMVGALNANSAIVGFTDLNGAAGTVIANATGQATYRIVPNIRLCVPPNLADQQLQVNFVNHLSGQTLTTATTGAPSNIAVVTNLPNNTITMVPSVKTITQGRTTTAADGSLLNVERVGGVAEISASQLVGGNLSFGTGAILTQAFTSAPTIANGGIVQITSDTFDDPRSTTVPKAKIPFADQALLTTDVLALGTINTALITPASLNVLTYTTTALGPVIGDAGVPGASSVGVGSAAICIKLQVVNDTGSTVTATIEEALISFQGGTAGQVLGVGNVRTQGLNGGNVVDVQGKVTAASQAGFTQTGTPASATTGLTFNVAKGGIFVMTLDEQADANTATGANSKVVVTDSNTTPLVGATGGTNETNTTLAFGFVAADGSEIKIFPVRDDLDDAINTIQIGYDIAASGIPASIADTQSVQFNLEVSGNAIKTPVVVNVANVRNFAQATNVAVNPVLLVADGVAQGNGTTGYNIAATKAPATTTSSGNGGIFTHGVEVLPGSNNELVTPGELATALANNKSLSAALAAGALVPGNGADQLVPFPGGFTNATTTSSLTQTAIGAPIFNGYVAGILLSEIDDDLIVGSTALFDAIAGAGGTRAGINVGTTDNILYRACILNRAGEIFNPGGNALAAANQGEFMGAELIVTPGGDIDPLIGAAIPAGVQNVSYVKTTTDLTDSATADSCIDIIIDENTQNKTDFAIIALKGLQLNTFPATVRVSIVNTTTNTELVRVGDVVFNSGFGGPQQATAGFVSTTKPVDIRYATSFLSTLSTALTTALGGTVTDAGVNSINSQLRFNAVDPATSTLVVAGTGTGTPLNPLEVIEGNYPVDNFSSTVAKSVAIRIASTSTNNATIGNAVNGGSFGLFSNAGIAFTPNPVEIDVPTTTGTSVVQFFNEVSTNFGAPANVTAGDGVINMVATGNLANSTGTASDDPSAVQTNGVLTGATIADPGTLIPADATVCAFLAEGGGAALNGHGYNHAIGSNTTLNVFTSGGTIVNTPFTAADPTLLAGAAANNDLDIVANYINGGDASALVFAPSGGALTIPAGVTNLNNLSTLCASAPAQITNAIKYDTSANVNTTITSDDISITVGDRLTSATGTNLNFRAVDVLVTGARPGLKAVFSGRLAEGSTTNVSTVTVPVGPGGIANARIVVPTDANGDVLTGNIIGIQLTTGVAITNGNLLLLPAANLNQTRDLAATLDFPTRTLPQRGTTKVVIDLNGSNFVVDPTKVTVQGNAVRATTNTDDNKIIAEVDIATAFANGGDITVAYTEQVDGIDVNPATVTLSFFGRDPSGSEPSIERTLLRTDGRLLYAGESLSPRAIRAFVISEASGRAIPVRIRTNRTGTRGITGSLAGLLVPGDGDHCIQQYNFIRRIRSIGGRRRDVGGSGAAFGDFTF